MPRWLETGTEMGSTPSASRGSQTVSRRHRPSYRSIPVTILLSATLLTQGCTADATEQNTAPTTSSVPVPTAEWLPVAQPEVVEPTTTATYMAVELLGTLHIDVAAQCVWVEAHQTVAPIFPPGTVLHLGEPPALTMPNGVTVHDGDTIRGGGGSIGVALRRTPALQHVEISPQCMDIVDGALWHLAPELTATDD